MKKFRLLICMLVCIFAIGPAFATNIYVESSQNWDFRQAIVAEAKDFIGTPYVSAGISKEGVDCSGLVFRIYLNITERKLPRRVIDLIEAGEVVEGSPLPGDLAFFDTTGGPSHVGIFISDSEFIHAASAGRKTGVIISSLEQDYYRRRYLGARRYLPDRLPLVRVALDNEPAGGSIINTLPPGLPVNFSIRNLTNGSKFFDFNVYHDDRFIFSKRLKIRIGEEPTSVWFVPLDGKWKVYLEDQMKKSVFALDFYSGGSQ